VIRPPLAPWSLALWAAAPEAVSRGYGLLRHRRARRAPGRLRAGEFLQGAALLLRREAFDAVGGFDERFFMYGEDADLCERLRAAGWEVELCPAARFVHLGAASTSGRADAMHRELLRSWLRLIAKRDGMGRAERARRALLVALRVRAAVAPRSEVGPVAGWLAASTAAELLGGAG
jgi:GT2 family glycosyltransferase